MARTMGGCPTPQPPEGASEPKTNPSDPQQEEQPDAAEGKVMTDYNPDIDCAG